MMKQPMMIISIPLLLLMMIKIRTVGSISNPMVRSMHSDEYGAMVLSRKLNDAPSVRLFCTDSNPLQPCPSL